MCGIAGILEFEPGVTPPAEIVRRMCEVIRHRGPDDQGVYCRSPIGLGARRLSIIDLATGHQPLSNESQSVWVVLNGEIYNFRELREKLEPRGHRFSTATDTEVIAHLYEDYGEDFVHQLRGMFAIALWDNRERRLLLVRDRMGIKPLYYSQQPKRLLFGSELKCLLQVPGTYPSVDLEAVNRYLSLGYIPAPDTIFQGVRKLAPGHLLVVEGPVAREKQYWELPWPEDARAPTEEECCEQLRAELRESVRLHLVSDVPLGALLSGGIDSSTVVAVMSRLMDRPVKTFSIGFSEEDFNELAYARQVARCLGTDHHELVVRPKAAELVERLLGYFDEPFGDASAVPTFLVSQLARQSVTVALSGDGGDELFAGYERYPEASRQGWFDLLPRALRRNVLLPLSQKLPYRAYGKNYLRRMALTDGLDRYLDAILLPLPVKERLVAPEFRAAVGSLDCSEASRQFVSDGLGRPLLDRILYLDTKMELPGDILTKVDRMSMANSLEVRVPLLDHVLVEFVARLPLRLKLRGDVTKYLFRKAFGNLLPSSILERPKMGFALPLRQWFAHELYGFLSDVLFDSRTLSRGYLQREFLDVLVREHANRRRDNSHLLWRLLALELWHRQVSR